MQCAGLTTSLSTDFKTYTLLTSVHNNADDTDDANDYNGVIGIAQLKAFCCAKKDKDPTIKKSGVIHRYKCDMVESDEGYIGESSRTVGEVQGTSKCPFPNI